MNSPYREEPVSQIQSATDLFGRYRVVPTKKRQTERGELLRYFSQKTGWTIPRLCGRMPPGLTLEDLYYLKSAADGYEREGKGAWSKAFFGALKPRV